MLSSSTLAFLSQMLEKSHAAYSEGGLCYTYVEAANQAHSRFPEGSSGSLALTELEIGELGRFIEMSQGYQKSQSVTTECFALAEQLFGMLQTDLEFDVIAWSLEDDGYDMNACLKMARRTDNCFFSLELFWSVD